MAEKPPPLPIVVRPCFEQDLQAVQFIYAHHVLHGAGSFELDPPDLETIRARWTKIVAAGLPFLIACPQADPTRVIGFSYASRFHERAAYAHTFEDSVYVAPGMMQRGVGYTLVNGLLHDLQHPTEVREILALIGDSANAASIALHSKLLFQPVGKLNKVGRKFGRALDVVIMQRNIATRQNA